MKEKPYFNDMLKILAKEKGYTQEALAKEMGVSVNTVKKWYATTMPDFKTLVRLGDALDCEMGYLIGSQEYPRMSDEIDELKERIARLEKILRETKNSVDLLLVGSGMV